MKYGNVGRFFNHVSRSPELYVEVVLILAKSDRPVLQMPIFGRCNRMSLTKAPMLSPLIPQQRCLL